MAQDVGTCTINVYRPATIPPFLFDFRPICWRRILDGGQERRNAIFRGQLASPRTFLGFRGITGRLPGNGTMPWMVGVEQGERLGTR